MGVGRDWHIMLFCFNSSHCSYLMSYAICNLTFGHVRLASLGTHDKGSTLSVAYYASCFDRPIIPKTICWQMCGVGRVVLSNRVHEN